MDFDAGAREGAAGEVGFLGFDEVDSAVDGSMNGIVAGEESARTGDFGTASLADENFTSFYFLAAKAFDA